MVLSKLETSSGLFNDDAYLETIYDYVRYELKAYSLWDLLGACETELLAVIDDAGLDNAWLDRELLNRVGPYNNGRGLWLHLVEMLRKRGQFSLSEENVNNILEVYKLIDNSDARVR